MFSSDTTYSVLLSTLSTFRLKMGAEPVIELFYYKVGLLLVRKSPCGPGPPHSRGF